MGAEAIKELLMNIDLEKSYEELSEEIKVTKSQAKNKETSNDSNSLSHSLTQATNPNG